MRVGPSGRILETELDARQVTTTLMRIVLETVWLGVCNGTALGMYQKYHNYGELISRTIGVQYLTQAVTKYVSTVKTTMRNNKLFDELS